MESTVRTTLYEYEVHATASTTTEPDSQPPIDWSFLFRSQEEQLRIDSEKELERIKWNKIHIYERRKDIFR